MQTHMGEAGGDEVAGLVIDDGTGQYFVIGWDELRRFRVPAPYLARLQAVVTGAEPAGAADVSGYGGLRPVEQDTALLAEAVAVAAPGRGRLGVRRLRVWALLW